MQKYSLPNLGVNDLKLHVALVVAIGAISACKPQKPIEKPQAKVRETRSCGELQLSETARSDEFKAMKLIGTKVLQNNSFMTCTAAAISKRVLVTAAGCVKVAAGNKLHYFPTRGVPYSGIGALVETGIEPVRVDLDANIVYSGTPMPEPAIRDSLAFLSFSSDLFDETLSISQETPSLGSAVKLGGFGFNTGPLWGTPLSETDGIQPRVADHVIATPSSADRRQIAGTLYVEAASGIPTYDLGGLLIHQNSLVGVATETNISMFPGGYAYFAPLNSSVATNYISRLNSEGHDIKLTGAAEGNSSGGSGNNGTADGDSDAQSSPNSGDAEPSRDDGC